MDNTAYTNPLTGRREQITDARALGTVEERTAAAKASQAAFESRFGPAKPKSYGCPCAICRHS